MQLRVKEDGEPLGVTIRRARDAANLSQAELAWQLGVSMRTVQNWESGRIPRPRPKHRRALALFLAETDGAAA